jgi:hypothetical protein
MQMTEFQLPGVSWQVALFYDVEHQRDPVDPLYRINNRNVKAGLIKVNMFFLFF